MSLSLRSSSNNFHDNERVTRARRSTKLNRFLSFNENQSPSTESRRRSFQSTPNLIELLEDDEEDSEEYEVLCYECTSCSKIFASEFGLNHHTNMNHPNQSVLCSLCDLTFASHRSLKTHQQRRHSSHQTLKNHSKIDQNEFLPDYSYISSYLVLAFSSRQFPLVAKIACEQKRLPLGTFASRLYQCHFCQVSFPCSRTLKFHLLDQHEHFEYDLCENLLHEIILKVEENLRTVENHEENLDENDFQSISIELAKQATNFGLRNKNLMQKSRMMKNSKNRQIYPSCQHQQRTCANLCLSHLSSYNRLVQNYNYTIITLPKGNPFAQGSIVSQPSLSLTKPTSNSNQSSNSNPTQDSSNGRIKRRNFNQTNSSSSNSSKKKSLIPSATNNHSKIHRSVSIKSEADHSNRINETKSSSNESTSISSSTNMQKRNPVKDNLARSTSISGFLPASPPSNNTSGKSSNSKPRTPKRNSTQNPLTSNEIPSAKRRRTRAQTNKKQSTIKKSMTQMKIDDDRSETDLEQENGDGTDTDRDGESDVNGHDDDDVIPIPIDNSNHQRTSTKRHGSNESEEYIQILDEDPPSLNNIENFKSKSQNTRKDIILSRSRSPVQKLVQSSNKNYSKTTINGSNNRKTKNHQTSKNDENIRVRCKVCGAILKGRRRFSEHVIELHGHLLIKKSTVNEQASQQTAVIR